MRPVRHAIAWSAFKVCLILALACPDHATGADTAACVEERFTYLCYYAALGSATTADQIAFELAARYSSADCARVTIDGYPGNFILAAHLAAACCRMNNWTNAIAHGERALSFRTMEGMAGAPERMSRLLLDLARAYGSASIRRYDKAGEYRAWARELDWQNAQLSQKLALEAAAAARRRRRTDEAEAILRDAIARHGFAKRIVYAELSRLLSSSGRRAEAFDLWLVHLKEARLDFHEDFNELGIDKLWHLLPHAGEHQLYACRLLLQSLPARYPATIEYAPYIGALEAAANDERLHIELVLRTAAQERTAAMETRLRAVLAAARAAGTPVPRRVYLYLGDNLCARGRHAEAIAVWLEGMAAAPDAHGNGAGEWFAKRILDNRAHATSGQVSQCAMLLVTRAHAAKSARVRLAAGGQLEALGFPEHAIDVWLAGLAQQPRPYIETADGDWFMQKLDERLARMTAAQKQRYADVLAALAARWRDRPEFQDALPLLEAKRASLAR